MRDTADELADGLHLLRLAELIFNIFVFGDILDHGDTEFRVRDIISDERDREKRAHGFTVLADKALFHSVARHLTANKLCGKRLVLGVVVGVGDVGSWPVIQFAQTVSQHLGEGGIAVEQLAVDSGDGDAECGVFK